MQQSPELSMQYFNEGKKARHQGDFKRAIEMFKNSILVYQADPDMPTNFYSLGKTYYLDNNTKMSLSCYEVYNNLCTLMNPPILEDYKSFHNSQPYEIEHHSGEDFLESSIRNFTKSYATNISAQTRFQGSFRNLAHNIGHTIDDPKNTYKHSEDIKFYRSQLLGQNSDIPTSSYERYDAECTLTGFNQIYSWMDNFLKNTDMQKYTLNLMNNILNA